LTYLTGVEQSALQIIRNVSVAKLIDRCSLLVGIAPNFCSFSPILIALNNRLTTKEKKHVN
jgi:hypothetical protein